MTLKCRTEVGYRHCWQFPGFTGGAYVLECHEDGTLLDPEKEAAFRDFMARVDAGELVYRGIQRVEYRFLIS